MFLKKEKFTWQKESLTIFELSALQRIEYITFMASEEKAVISDDEPDDDTLMTAAEGITGGIRYGPAD